MNPAMRQRLPNRRASQSFSFVCNALKHTATVSFFEDGQPAEIFLSNGRAGSDADTNAKDAAVVCSLALQQGVPLDVIRRALMRDVKSCASGPLATALDMLAERDEQQ